MIIGEVCLLTNDVPRLASFYKQLLGADNGSDDKVHQEAVGKTSRPAAVRIQSPESGGQNRFSRI